MRSPAASRRSPRGGSIPAAVTLTGPASESALIAQSACMTGVLRARRCRWGAWRSGKRTGRFGFGGPILDRPITEAAHLLFVGRDHGLDLGARQHVAPRPGLALTEEPLGFFGALDEAGLVLQLSQRVERG